MSDYTELAKPVAVALLGEPREKRGTDWRWGNHGSLSLNSDTGAWYDHEAGEGGGILDLIMRETGRATLKAAIAWLEENGYKEREEPEQAKPKQKARIVKTYDYADEHGELRYQVCRMEPKGFRQRRPDGSGWKWSVKGVEQLPYRLGDMLSRPSATVLVTEGEKDADKLAEMGFVATCNSGGAGKWPDELNQWFAGRRVVILPDNDQAGRDHAEQVAKALHDTAENIRVVYLPGLPEKGDPFDWVAQGGTDKALADLCKAADTWKPSFDEEPEPVPEEARHETDADHGMPFKCLGYDGGTYYYLPRGTEQVAEIRRGSHTSPAELMSLAPIEWWDVHYPKGDSGTDWQAAASDLMRRCERRGVYSLKNVRGRGAWYDKGASVLHLGDRLIVDGHAKPIIDHHSQYIYTRQSQMESIIDASPATDDEGFEVFALFDQLNWESKSHAILAAGWTALAPICGALSWRPHIWLTAQRGAGKSWVQENIIHPLLGQSAMMVQGGTTEAGVRQALGQDARPVVFDEAESEDHAAQRRMKSVLELARQASSDGSAEIVKGTASGGGMSFRIRSMFMLGSVNVSLSQAADESRFSVLTLKQPDKSAEEIQRFTEFSKYVGNTLTSERCAAIRSRMYRLIPIIRQNAQTMAQAVAEELGSQRIGDQIGTLLAGAASLTRSDAIPMDEARAWAREIDLSEAQESEEVSDEMMCLNAILQQQIRFDSPAGTMLRAVSEVVMAAANERTLHIDMSPAECNDVLRRYGLGVADGCLLVSNSHAEIKRLLKDTPWAAGWRRVLARVDGAVQTENPVRFAGTRTRAVYIPISSFD